MEAPVICRLCRQTLGVITFFGLCTLLLMGWPLFVPTNLNSDIVTAEVLLFLSLGVPTLLLLHAYRKCRLTANENALEIRGMFTTKLVEWHKVSDFYYELAPSGNKSQKPSIFIEYGKHKQMLSRNFDNLPALLERIELKATNANSKKFEFKETRIPLDTPQIFEYRNLKIWQHVLMALVGWAVIIALMLGPTIVQKGWSNFYAWNFAVLPPMMRLGLVTLLLLITGAFPLMCLAGIPNLKTAQKFHGQQIIISKSGIEWSKGANKVQIPWEQIRSYHLERIKGHLQNPLWVVKSERERISFHGHITKSRVLRLLISQNATNANNDSWQYTVGQNEEILGRDSSVGADGKQIFHYRTRSNRSMLYSGLIYCLLIIPAKLMSDHLKGEPDYSILLMVVPLTMAIFYGCLSYWLTRIEITSTGVLHVTPFKKSFLAWNDVQALKIPNSKLFYLVIGENKTIRIVTLIIESKEFRKTLAEHTGKTWDTEEEKGDFLIGH